RPARGGARRTVNNHKTRLKNRYNHVTCLTGIRRPLPTVTRDRTTATFGSEDHHEFARVPPASGAPAAAEESAEDGASALSPAARPCRYAPRGRPCPDDLGGATAVQQTRLAPRL